MTNNIGELRELIYSYPLTEGENKTKLPYLTIYLSAQRKIDVPQTENFYIYTVLDGSIRLFTPSGIMDYVPGQKSKEIGIDVSFAISDENGLPRAYRRYGEALVLSITLVQGKAYTAAVTQCKTKEVSACSVEGGPLMAIQTNDPKITLVAGGYPLFVNGKIAGGIGVGGGTEEQDCAIAEYVVSVFNEMTK